MENGTQTEASVMRLGDVLGPPETWPNDSQFRDFVRRDMSGAVISSVEVREALSEPLQQIVDALMQSLEKTPPELASDIVDRGIVMTGGGSLLRGIDMLLREATNLPITVAEDPLSCVVLGTGKILDDPTQYEKVLMSVVRD